MSLETRLIPAKAAPPGSPLSPGMGAGAAAHTHPVLISQFEGFLSATTAKGCDLHPSL